MTDLVDGGQAPALVPTLPEAGQRRAWRAFRRNPLALAGLLVVGLVALLALSAPWVTPYSPSVSHISFRNAPPLTQFEPKPMDIARCHWLEIGWLSGGCRLFLLGSDPGGIDLWSLTVYGARTSLAIALVASVASLVIGVSFGSVAGWRGGRVDEAMMRLVDMLYALPVFLVALAIQSFFQRFRMPDSGLMPLMARWNEQLGGLLFLFIAFGAVNWVNMARMARAMVHSAKRVDYVQAAQAVGTSEGRIISRHILPNIVGPLLVLETLAIPGYIFLEATLSFLGLGVGSNGVSWGGMIHRGYTAIRSHPHVILVPSIALSLLTLAFNFMGDGLRDAADPQLRGRRHA